MRRFIQKIFKPFFTWLADRFSSSPKREDVFKSLSKLYRRILSPKKTSKGIVINTDLRTDQFIIFSDQHKGNKDHSDDFVLCETNYIAALQYYHQQCFTYINLGDCEELWKYPVDKVIANNKAALNAEANFQPDKKYYRTFGNHDLLWKNSLDVLFWLKDVFTMPQPVYEGLVLRTTIADKPLHIFLTHGHQGDKMSDNNPVSTWIIAHLWAPIQRFLEININTPATDLRMRDKHNIMMHEWSSRKKDLILITGHTHKPVFASGKYADKESHKIEQPEHERTIKPSYFNTGCCCYSDGDITGIEIAGGFIRLVKWETETNTSKRIVLEEMALEELVKDL